MSKFICKNGYLVLELYDKITKRSVGSPFVTLVSSHNLAIIVESSNADLPVGIKVYFKMANTEKFMKDGKELIAVLEKDIIGILVESDNDKDV